MTTERWRWPLRGFVAIIPCLALLILTGKAAAGVAAYNEPAYTKTAGNNAFWFNWTAVTGLNENSTYNYTYYLCLTTHRNGIQEEFSSGINGPATQNCTGSLRSGPTPSTGNNGFHPYSSGTILADGSRYQMCATGFRWYVYLWSFDNTSCASTIIDRSAPSLSVALAGGSNLTNNPAIPARIGYSDTISPPWAGSNGYASNWVCISQGTTCAPGGQPNNNCSAPNAGFNNRINSFDCSLNITGGDGTYHFCARGADAAVPDNASGTNQFQNATSNNANLSATACDSVILDRAGPTVSISPSATSVTVGQRVSFSASATDPNGLSGPTTWTFGDNTASSTGTSTTHTYTQPGTYVAKATQSDAAGNVGERTVTITVNPAPSPGTGGNTGGGSGGDTGGSAGGGSAGGGSGGDTGGSAGGGGSTGGGATGGGSGTVVPGVQQGTSGAAPVPGTMTPSQLGNQVQQTAGGGGATNVAVGALDVVAPKKFTAGKRTLLLAFTADRGGRVNVAFLRGAKVVAKRGATLGGEGTYTLKVKVPAKLRAGSYKLKVTFKPTGASRATTRTLKVKVVARKKKRRSSRRVIVPAKLGGSPASRSRSPRAVDPRAVRRTLVLR